MEFRTQKAAFALVALSLWPAPAAQQPIRYEVRHDHFWKSGAGTLVIDGEGVTFQERDKRKHAWRWAYQDIQQLEIAPKTLRLLSYEDSKWKLGADRGYRFDLTGDGSFVEAYRFLRDRLDQRLVAALADTGVKPLWEIPVKHLERFGGKHGVLIFGEERIVFRTDREGESRSWRYSDIENISSAGPFQLTLTTYERALSHYGNRKGFNFQLKQPLDEARYDEAWRRINGHKGLNLLSSYKERSNTQ